MPHLTLISISSAHDTQGSSITALTDDIGSAGLPLCSMTTTLQLPCGVPGSRYWVASADGQVAMLMNLTIPLRHGAWLNILLAVFIILELGLFIAWLNYITIRMLVQPLTRILAILRKNARHVLNSVESEVSC